MTANSNKQDVMSGVVKIGIVVAVVCLGLWGCSGKPAPRMGSTSGSNDRAKALEARCQKLEAEGKALTSARDQARRELSALEGEMTRLQKELASKAELVRERDQLLAQVRAFTGEREVLHTRCEKLRLGLQKLLNQDDGPNPAVPTVPTATPIAGPSLGTQG